MALVYPRVGHHHGRLFSHSENTMPQAVVGIIMGSQSDWETNAPRSRNAGGIGRCP